MPRTGWLTLSAAFRPRAALLDSLVIVALALVFAIPTVSAAQSAANGTIRGKVADETGAALPGVSVTIASPALLVGEIVAVTSEDGAYTFPDIPIGEYRVSYQLSGFQRLVREDIL